MSKFASIIKIQFESIPYNGHVVCYSPIVTFGGLDFEPSEPRLLYYYSIILKYLEIHTTKKCDLKLEMSEEEKHRNLS